MSKLTLKSILEGENKLNEKRLVNEFCKLVSIDSPSFHERKMADTLKGYLEELGFEVHEDNAGEIYKSECGNLYGYLEGTMEGEPLLFAAHMDTVDPAIGKKAVLKEDGRIESDGTTVLGADDISGIAAILEAIRSLKENNIPHRGIEVLFTIAEEPYLRGSKVFDYAKIKSKDAYVLDLSGPIGGAAHIAPSIIKLVIDIKGKASHAGFAPEKGLSAIVLASKVISKLKLGHIDEETTANIGIISGGLATNIVPESCKIQGEVRSTNHEKALEQAENIKNIFRESIKELGGNCEVDIIIGQYAYAVEENHKVIKRYEKVCKDLNIPFALNQTFGGSDNNNFFHNGITGIVIACAMNQVHSCNEYTSVQDLMKITNIVQNLMTSKDY